jgi:hypothetical protein
MRNEALYLTLAQVLPALLIVLVLELRSGGAAALRAFRKAESLLEDLPEEHRSSARYRRSEALRRNLIFRLVRRVAAWTFAVGETFCLAASVFGVANWFAWVAGPISLLAVASMSACVILLPTLAEVDVDLDASFPL